MSPETAVWLALAVPLVGAVPIALTGWSPNLRETITLVTATLLFVIVASLLPEVLAGAFLSRRQDELGILDADIDQVVLECAFVFEVGLGLPLRDLVEWRLGDIEVALLDQLRHLPVEEREQQRTNVGAVNIGIGHDDDAVIAQLFDVEVIAADAGAECGDERADLGR